MNVLKNVDSTACALLLYCGLYITIKALWSLDKCFDVFIISYLKILEIE